MKKSEAGQALLPVAFGMVAFSAMLGLAIDVGYLRYLKRELQTAADGAAIAGAAEINYSDVTSAAKADAASNGFTDQSNGVTVTVNPTPLSGPHQGQSGYVEVLITKTQPTFFMRVVPGVPTSSTVTARAVAYLGNARGCIYALNASPGNITIGVAGRRGGNVTLTSSCAVMDNGDLTLLGRADNFTASSIGVSGNYYRGNRSTVSPTPVAGMIPAADPLAYLPTQNPGNCDHTNYPAMNAGNQILQPGVYCGGIVISGTANVTFNSGLYVMTPSRTQNPGLSITGNANVTGNGVTFYDGANSAAVTIESNGIVSLTAPTSGGGTVPNAYAGVLIFQDPNNSNNAYVEGGNSSTLQGAIYVPNLGATLTIDNVGNNAAYTIAVAGSLDVRGANAFGSDYSSLTNGSPIKDAVLVE